VALLYGGTRLLIKLNQWNNSVIKVSLKIAQLTKMPQMIDEINIYPISLKAFALKESAINVPPIGVKSGGVNKAIPKRPSLFQIFTANRLLFVKILFLVLGLLSKYLVIVFAKIVVKITATIMPLAESMMVALSGTPIRNPAIGPPKNLSMLPNITEKYFAISNVCSDKSFNKKKNYKI
jgi:hypothetical protein